MSQETTLYEDIIGKIVDYTGEAGGEIQRYIVVPSLLEMIGPLSGMNVLDLYCGAGYLARRMASLGASVTAVDNSEKLVSIAGEIDNRENHGIKYSVAEPSDIPIMDDSAFDVIVCNMGLMMSRDLTGTVAELARLVKLGGRFVFSVLHPCFTMPDSCWISDEDGKGLYKTVDRYFAEGWWSSDLAATIRSDNRKYKHRTLARYINALSSRGFNVRRIIEPRPSPQTLTLKPHLDIYDRVPVAMVVEAVFPYL